MKHYIAYIDVLGARNSSEKEDFDFYLNLISDFQNELLRAVKNLEDGRIHFFSDCAFIESKNLISLINCIRDLRDSLFDATPTFIRGAITLGVLGAINGTESKDFIQNYYQDKNITNRFLSLKKNLNKYEKEIKGTLFLSKDIAKLVYYEQTLKGAAIYLDESVLSDIEVSNVVNSGYLSDVNKKEYYSFYDISYNQDEITESFIEKLLRTYYKSNVYDVNYGRYYLTILISCINSEDFSQIIYNEENNEFENSKPIFDKIMNLRLEYKELYNNVKGLEYVYFCLINKLYSDIGETNRTTRIFVKKIMYNKKHLGAYSNKISQVPKSILSPRIKNFMLKDLMHNIENPE